MTVILTNVFHFVEHTHKSTSAHPHLKLPQLTSTTFSRNSFATIPTSPPSSPSLHPSTLASCFLHLISCKKNIHQSPSFSVLHQLLPFHPVYQYSTSQPVPKCAHQIYKHAAGDTCTLQEAGCTFIFMVGKCRPRQPSGMLVPTMIDCHENFGARCYTESMPLLNPNHSAQTCGITDVITSTTIL